MKKDKGKKFTCDHYKSLYVVAVALSTKSVFTPIPFTKVDKKGRPLALKPLVPYLTSTDVNSKRIGLTIARVYLTIVLPSSFDPSPITREMDKPLCKDFLRRFETFCEKFTKSLGILGIDRPPISSKLIGRLVAGPNGPAILTSHQDARAVVDNPTLYNHIITYSNLTSQK